MRALDPVVWSHSNGNEVTFAGGWEQAWNKNAETRKKVVKQFRFNE